MSYDNNQLWCRIRKEVVAALPEEVVRQNLLTEMIDRLGYPAGLISVERALRQLPHLLGAVSMAAPDRRADILCYGKGIHPDHDLYPLLLIECKAVPLTERVIRQVVGYNHYVQAAFIAVVNGVERKTGWYDVKKGDYRFVAAIPAYGKLVEAVSSPPSSHGAS